MMVTNVKPRATLLLGDCKTELIKVPTDSVDLIVTSPPYANRRSSEYPGVKADEYCDWLLPISDQLLRVLKPTGTFILNIKEPAVNGQRHTHVIELILAMRERGWLWTEEYIWHKKNAYPGKWPNRFRDAWERLLQFNKQRDFKMNQQSVMVPVGEWYESRMKNLSDTDRVRDESKVGSGFGKKVENWVGRELVYPTNVLHGATECSNRNHSAAFPYWLPEWFIKLFTDPGDTVLDPFIGSGTTSFAALEHDRNIIGVDLHEPYYTELRLKLEQNYEVSDMVGAPSPAITDEEITQYVERNIGSFHEKRLDALENLKLDELLLRKNPYLFRSKNLHSANELLRFLLDAHLSSQEETMFGDFLEGLAIFIAEKVHNGWKSGILGIDLEFIKDDDRYLVSIKSGPNWGNSSQIKKMKIDFDAARTVIQGSGRDPINFIAVNGCCYGRDRKPFKGSHFKFCGQDFWQLISNDSSLYTRMIEPLGHESIERNEMFDVAYGNLLNRITPAFIDRFCMENGQIYWEKLVRYNSGITPELSLPVTTIRPINQLRSLESVCDVLVHWRYPELIEKLCNISEFANADDENSSETMESLRGLLMFIGTVKSEGNLNVTSTHDGLVSSEWSFIDDRCVTLTFLDIDRVRIGTVTSASGEPINIRNSQRVTRKTAIKRLVENGLFTLIEVA